MLSAVWLHPDNEPGVLILAVHHLAADPISWRVIMSELEARWQAVAHQVPSDVDQTSIGPTAVGEFAGGRGARREQPAILGCSA